MKRASSRTAIRIWLVVWAASWVMPACTPPEEKALATIDAFIAQQSIDKQQSGWKLKVVKPPQLEFAAGHDYFWNLETNKGGIKIKLHADTAPMHVSSTLYLTRLGFYDGVVFHRVIPGFMIQGGDPTGTGRGGPAYKYAGEFGGDRSHDVPGVLSMANSGPNTDGSQFFLTLAPTAYLDGKHTVFGQVVEGMDTLETLASFGSRGSGQTREKLVIEKATISLD